MSYKVKTTELFERQAKRLLKKYSSLKIELFDLVHDLKESPQMGTPIGRNCYKIRLSIASKGRGKSGGARLITSLVVSDDTVYLLSIYDKSEKENLSNKELNDLLRDIPD